MYTLIKDDIEKMMKATANGVLTLSSCKIEKCEIVSRSGKCEIIGEVVKKISPKYKSDQKL